MYTSAQYSLPYKPLSDFGKDTTAFIMYNFMERGDCYEGKTFKDIVDDLKIPIKDFVISSSMQNINNSDGIYIYIYPLPVIEKLKEELKDANIIEIIWENELDVDEVHSIKRKYGQSGWNANIYDYFEKMKIKNVRVLVFKYSKYYKTYKNTVVM